MGGKHPTNDRNQENYNRRRQEEDTRVQKIPINILAGHKIIPLAT